MGRRLDKIADYFTGYDTLRDLRKQGFSSWDMIKYGVAGKIVPNLTLVGGVYSWLFGDASDLSLLVSGVGEIIRIEVQERADSRLVDNYVFGGLDNG